MKKNGYAVFIILMMIYNGVAAQSIRQNSSNTNAWFMYFGSHKLSDKFGLHLEAQIRRNDGISRWQQFLFRTGLNYHFNSNVFASAGYCFVETYPYGAFPAKANFPEHRLWEQLQIKNQVGRFETINRLRLEQRFSKVPVLNASTNDYEPGDAVYTNRFRVLNRVSIPFKGKLIVDKSFYITAYDEVMINFGRHTAMNIFDQNRFYIALGYKIPIVGRLEIGYMEQTIVKGDGLKIENNHTVQIGLMSTIDFMRKKKK